MSSNKKSTPTIEDLVGALNGALDQMQQCAKMFRDDKDYMRVLDDGWAVLDAFRKNAAEARLAEPEEDARALVYLAWQIVTSGESAVYNVAKEPEAAAIIERYVAAQARKAREEEREACAERAVAWLEKPYALSGNKALDYLRAAIKEAPDA